jgi:hypothetical protein
MRDAGRQGTGRFLKFEIEQEATETTEKKGLSCSLFAPFSPVQHEKWLKQRRKNKTRVPGKPETLVYLKKVPNRH